MHKCLVMGGTDLNNYIILFGLIQEPEVANQADPRYSGTFLFFFVVELVQENKLQVLLLMMARIKMMRTILLLLKIQMQFKMM